MNNEKQLKDLIGQKESEQLEFKEVVSKESIAKTLCSFLNTKGGRVIIGIDNEGEIKGLINASSYKLELEKYLVETIVPDAPIDISIEKVDDVELLIIKVWEGSKQPYIYDGTIYYRKDDTTIRATSQEISSLIHQRQKDEQHWERQIALGVEWDDLDHKLIKETLVEAVKKHRSSYKGKDLQEFLKHYGLMSNELYTNACVVLFAKNAARYLPQTRVRLTEYSKSKTEGNLIRDDFFEGSLFAIRDKLENYVNNLGVKSHFADHQWKRVDFLYPVKALQEGFINALMHRDYSSFSSHLTIGVFPDKIIIANSGQLPKEIEIKDLKKFHRSFPVNPDIAHMVFLRGLIDKLGKGTNKIVEGCKEAGLRAPVWKENKGEVVLTFNGPKKLPQIIGSLTGSTYGKTTVEGVIGGATDVAIGGAIGGAIDGVSNNVKDRLIGLIKIILNNPGIKNVDLQEVLNVSERTITSDVKRLRRVYKV